MRIYCPHGCEYDEIRVSVWGVNDVSVTWVVLLMSQVKSVFLEGPCISQNIIMVVSGIQSRQ